MKVAAGPRYPLALWPWLVFDAPGARPMACFVVNILLAGAGSFIGSELVVRLCAVRSWLTPPHPRAREVWAGEREPRREVLRAGAEGYRRPS